MPLQDLLEIAMFSLEHTIIKRKGTILKQVLGIPMGDPLSPAMTIGTCCWMEQRWMTQQHPSIKEMFRAKRYMDDILLMYVKSVRWQDDEFIKRFEASECYWPPLELEDGGEGTFLETRFKIEKAFQSRSSYPYFRMVGIIALKINGSSSRMTPVRRAS